MPFFRAGDLGSYYSVPSQWCVHHSLIVTRCLSASTCVLIQLRQFGLNKSPSALCRLLVEGKEGLRVYIGEGDCGFEARRWEGWDFLMRGGLKFLP